MTQGSGQRGTFTMEWLFSMLVHMTDSTVRVSDVTEISLTEMLCKHGGHNVLRCFDTWGNGGNVAKTLSFEHSGLLCCDP